MSPLAALQNKIYSARSLAYIPDPEGKDFIEALALDRWETAAEVEARGGADCDGLSAWAIQRGYELSREGEWALVAGRVKQRGQWAGHAWVELIHEGTRYWADPTWGWLPKRPDAHGYPESRRPVHRWVYDGVIFARQETFMEIA